MPENRYIEYPQFVADKWKGVTNHIVPLTPNYITDHFREVLLNANLPHFHFHDLRHYSASIQYALGVPDSYIMQRSGLENDSTLKAVYRHVIEDKVKEMDNKTNSHFEELYNTKCNTQK